MAGTWSGGRADQVARVETLLTAVRDIASSLHSMSSQLEREVGEVLEEHVVRRPSEADQALEALKAENAQLKQALEGRALIERAKGLLMATYRCGEEPAFNLLVALSRRERRKLRTIAAEIVERHQAVGEGAGSADEPSIIDLARARGAVGLVPPPAAAAD